jgi:MIP family channel proteins
MNAHAPSLIRCCLAEAFGTFALLFAGTGAIVINAASGGEITHVGIALTFGLIVMSLIYTLGDISGCHLNPAVSIAFCLAGRFDRNHIMPYIASQCAGAILASFVLRGLFPDSKTLGATLPAGSDGQSFALEFLLTLILMVVILRVSSGSKEKGIMAGVAVGSVIALEAMFAGPISGASMNPARSLAPALVSLQTQHLWVYLIAPTLGAATGVAIDRAIAPPAPTLP